MNVPTILNKPDFLDSPLTYKWDEASSGFYHVDAKNIKVYDSFTPLNYKATYGMATALCEWIYWRVIKYVENPVPLAIMGIEGQWASLVDKHYSFVWQYSGEYISDSANGPIWAMLKIINRPKASYYMGDSAFAGIDKLVMLARHIAPDQVFFDEWFKKTMKKSAKLFPFTPTTDNPAENYDCSFEPVIPREFYFEPDYDYEKADNVKLINQFLSSLDYNNNRTLHSPEKMLELGFTGTPYKYWG